MKIIGLLEILLFLIEAFFKVFFCLTGEAIFDIIFIVWNSSKIYEVNDNEKIIK